MRKSITMPSWPGVLLLLGATAFTAGCHQTGYVCPTDRCADIPSGAIPQPAGIYSCQWQTEQKLRAEQDKFVIYQYEWFQGGDQLGPAGRRHVETIAQRLDGVSYPVIVEKSDATKLDETRRTTVIAALTSFGATQAQQRVIFGYSEAEGLDGPEAVRLGNRSPAAPGNTPGGGGYGPTNSGFGAGTTFGGGTGGLGGGSGAGMGLY
jgi:hypothetical protein